MSRRSFASSCRTSILVLGFCLLVLGRAFSPSPQLQRAIQLSKVAESNVVAALEACGLWRDILSGTQHPPPPSVVGLMWTLYASCLVRVGQDEDALKAYDNVVRVAEDSKVIDEARRGRARSLQRLLRYDEARDAFLLCRHQQMEAATCSLRLADVSAACNILQEVTSQEALALRAVCRHLRANDLSTGDVEAIRRTSDAGDPLYQWIASRLGIFSDADDVRQTWPRWSANELFAVNIGPFDDPTLLTLDDKVLLHSLLRGQDASFWPRGLLWPVERDLLADDENGSPKRWMLKRRSGYGSHGNTIVSRESLLAEDDSSQSESLLQEMVENLLLLDGRKFSLRIYVVYLTAGDATGASSPKISVSSRGLVKLASEALQDAGAEDDLAVHSTNSGRTMKARQESLDYLAAIIGDTNFGNVWNQIRTAVHDTMDAFVASLKHGDKATIYRKRLARLYLPKILGFDFVVDQQYKVHLLEVNRFPGLQPRNDHDAAIKHAIVRAAWMHAAQECDTAIEWKDWEASNVSEEVLESI